MKIKQQIINMLTVISLILISVNTSFAAELTHQQAQEIKSEIKQLVDDYGYYRDILQPEGHANVFAEDGKFMFRGEVYQGREAIAKRIEEHETTGLSMHMMSSSHVDIIDANNATGVHYAAVYSVTPEQPLEEGEIFPVNGPNVIGKYIDKYVLTSEGWKISERQFTRVFSTTE